MGRNNAMMINEVVEEEHEQLEILPIRRRYSQPEGPASHIYVRPVSGFGDAVMLRPAIVANMIKYPDDKHTIFSVSPFLDIYNDIDGLTIVDTPGARLDDKIQCIEDNARRDDIHYNVYNTCALYETKNQPYYIINNNGSSKAVPSGKHIILSRQEIWGNVVGVDFDINNYKVKFSDEELEKADYYKHYGRYMFLHMESADIWRSYIYRQSLVDYFAKRYDGYVFVMDRGFKYFGRCKNVVTFDDMPIRDMWVIISNATLMVGVDSAGVHLAGSVEVPTFGLFGPTDPKMRLLYKKVGWIDRFSRIRSCRQPCWYLPCKHLSCLRSITPRFIYNKVKKTFGDYL